MPTSAAEHRHATGRHHAGRPVFAPTPHPLDTRAIRRVETPVQALAAVLSITNATGMPTTTGRPPAVSAHPLQSANCIPVPPASGMPGALHTVAGLLRSPVSELFTDARNAWERHEGVRCAPPVGPGMRALLQAGDAAATIIEAAGIGARGVFALQTAGEALDLTADALEHKPLDRAELTDAALALGGARGLVEPGPARLDPDPVEDPRPARAPQVGIRQTSAELHDGRILVPFEGRERALGISEGRLQVLDDTGYVDVAFDSSDWTWRRVTTPQGTTSRVARIDSSIPLFDTVAAQLKAQRPLDHATLRLDLLGPEGILYYNDAVSGRAGNAVCVDGRYYAATLGEALSLRIGTLELVKRDGVYHLREKAPTPVRTLRCRRAPGEACAALLPEFSTELSGTLEAHYGRALDAQQARARGLQPDIGRPGWYISLKGGRLRHFVRYRERYFRVRIREVDEHTRRISVYLPRGTGAARLHRRGQPAHHIVDMRQAIPKEENRFMTQAEFNVEYRGMPSLEAAQVYESAVAQNDRLRLSQLQRAAIRSYLTWRRRSMDDFLQYGSLQPVFRDSDQVVARINRGLARIPPHAGRVYVALAVDAAQLAGLQEGQVVYSRTFLVASGDRGRAVSAAAGAGDGPQGASTVVTLQVQKHAHPTGLLSLQDEAQVMIGNNVLFKVTGKAPGELQLEELGAARQALGTLGAQPLLATPLRD
ncbi:hypothetical protein [Stenotrophomonas sp.]|uniref:hypothetical protein n=1 Tax=Stenotrophomonas sp. TaxID=69392 RepID=UPI002899273C|nr:hypothetical protein [Stenotrophomonas sp.]